jgi:hypothetical protein
MYDILQIVHNQSYQIYEGKELEIYPIKYLFCKL